MDFNELELIKIRHIVLRTANPTEQMLTGVTRLDPRELRKLIRRNLALILDPSIPLNQLNSALAESLRVMGSHIRSQPRIPPHIEIEGAPIKPPFKSRARRFTIPVLARSHEALTNRNIKPEIGSLVAVTHPALGKPYICRVIAQNLAHGVHPYFLIGFFQKDCSPCYVSIEYVFSVRTKYVSPIEDDRTFREFLIQKPISVDWLLEQIFSAAQCLVMEHNQQEPWFVFQYVFCAAMLIFCFVCIEWKLPDEKIAAVLNAIRRVSPAKYVTTMARLGNIEKIVRELAATA
jgi:hypothetical protein